MLCTDICLALFNIICSNIKHFSNSFVTSATGLLSVPGGLFGHALLRTDVTSAEKRPDIQLRFSAIAEDLGQEDDDVDNGKVCCVYFDLSLIIFGSIYYLFLCIKH